MTRLIICAFLGFAITPTSQALSFKDARFSSRITTKVHSPIRVACAGASITHGFDAPGDKYPVILQQLLGDDYNVTNLGVIGKVVQKEGLAEWPSPYWQTEEFEALMQPQWDIVVVMMGTSDAAEDPPYWNHEACDTDELSSNCKFWADYNELIKDVQKAGSPEIFIAVPPPVTNEDAYHINATVVNSILPRIIPKLAKENGIASDHVIDLFTGMGGDSVRDHVPEGGCTPDMETPSVCKYFCDNDFCDHVHPILLGKQKLASLVAAAIKSISTVRPPSVSH